MKLSKQQLIIGAGYVVFMLMFFFIGMPKITFLDGFIAAIIMTGFYYGIVKAVQSIGKKI